MESRPLHADQQDDRGLGSVFRIDRAFHFQFQKQCEGYRSQYTYFSSLVARTISLPKPNYNGGDSEVPLWLLYNNDHYYQHILHIVFSLTKINNSHNTRG